MEVSWTPVKKDKGGIVVGRTNFRVSNRGMEIDTSVPVNPSQVQGVIIEVLWLVKMMMCGIVSTNQWMESQKGREGCGAALLRTQDEERG
jgi:hypothetical protein